MAMKLSNIVVGKLEKPARILLHGTEGVGKSTFAAGAPSPIFVCAEDGTSQLEIARFPEPTSLREVHEALEILLTEKHDFQTLVIDTVDWLEPLVWAQVCTEHRKKSIEDFGYGAGYKVAFDAWRYLVARLDMLRNKRGMHVVLVAHSWIKAFSNPEGDNYDRYELKLHTKAAGLLKEWSDAVLFATYEQGTVKDGSKAKGISSGARIVRTERRAAFDAKNRYGLPFEMPLSWDEFWSGVQLRNPADTGRILTELRRCAEKLACIEKVEASIQRANSDPAKLAQLLDWARGKVQLQMQGEQ